MARRRFAPTHDICARARFVPPDDSAWDHDRIKAECDAMRKEAGWTLDETGTKWRSPPSSPKDPAMDPETGHPWHRYHLGMTRFDLEAEGVVNLLDMTAKPETWRLRLLSLDERAEFHFLDRTGQHERASRYAFLRGVDGLENATGETGEKLARLLAAKERNDEEVIAALMQYSASALGEVATAVMGLCVDLTAQEKKAFGSPGGERS